MVSILLLCIGGAPRVDSDSDPRWTPIFIARTINEISYLVKEIRMDRDTEWECGRVLTSFFARLDERRYDDLIALFAPDGEWIRHKETLKAGEGILAAMKARPADLAVQHVLTNLLVRGHGADAADARAILTVYLHRGEVAKGAPAPLAGPATVNVVEASLRRGESGFQIVRLSARTAFQR